ncbi:ABC transporter substrate-binding protein [Rhodococcus chondri]|uniref:ABC transporter substrate-binding protein n=1 Tax=Rhodococcus chondri TaxID=3065941 RepID=A0ABU7JYX6_9NOCA|nr:ABC transporter substrate-binding protein [Rhodococcus sp. CC-R104]MEE2035017.1 ABC transporter substrate-binding protein [Rhodococcus sp. CC-R104]
MKKSLRTAAVLAAGVFVLGACGQGDAGNSVSADGPSGDPVRGGELVYSYSVDASTLDPAACGSSTSWQACQAIYGMLMRFDPATGDYAPHMAAGLDTEDGRVWTLTLRDGVTFTDGTPYDADAVAYNWERARDPQNRSSAAAVAQRMTWQVVDPTTVRIELPAPNFAFPSMLYTGLGAIGSPAALEARGADFGANPVGAGPFTLETWSRGVEMQLARNDGYWDEGKPYLDAFTIKIIADERQRLAAVESGEADLAATILADSAAQVEQAGLALTERPTLAAAQGLRFNFADPAVADENLRRAVVLAMNVDEIAGVVHGGVGPATTIAPEGTRFHDPAAMLPSEDLAEAQRRFDLYRSETGLDTVDVQYMIVAGIPLLAQEAQMIKAQVERIDGLTLTVLPLEIAARQAALRNGDFMIANDSMGLNYDPEALYERYHTAGSENFGKYSDPQVDAALEASRASQDPAEVDEAYRAVLARLTETLGVRPLFYQTTTMYSRGDVGGTEPEYLYYPPADGLWIG